MVFDALHNELAAIADLSLLTSPADLDRYSRDAYDYSPVLREQLSQCRADLVVSAASVQAVQAVAAACHRHGVPLTLRGSGTGNYGQSVPLKGGVVLLMDALRKVRSIDPLSGVVTVECGCLMRDLDRDLAVHSRQLRLFPSTWRSATIGGFISGGSGGIGSVRWGFLRDPGHLLGLEVVTMEASPRLLQLEAAEAEALNHAYGTNGIITALTLSTAARVAWQEVVVDCPDWTTAVELAQRCGQAAVELNLCTVLQSPIVDRLPSWSWASRGQHRLLLLVAPDGVSTIERLASSVQAQVQVLGPEDNHQSNGLRELSWNHTTLHLRSNDPNWTYLQMLLPQPEIVCMEALQQRWGDDLVWHLEAVRQQGAFRLAALPVVYWRGAKALQDLIDDCLAKGAFVFNPHVLTVEGGGLGVIDGDQVAAKHRHDPDGLLNPGKLGGFPA